MRMLKRFAAEGRRFRQDERGVVIIWYTVIFAVTIALVGLAIDAVAFMNLHSSQQEVADAAALAGALKLDGTAGSRDRASTAAKTALGNIVSWSNDGASIACPDGTSPCPIQSVRIYDTLVALKAGTPLSTNDKTAAYISVTTTSRSYLTYFLRASGLESAATSVTAAAVSQYVTCSPLQSFMCNPYETVASTGDAASFMSSGQVHKGDQFVLVQGSGSDPGNWGIIQPIGTSGNAKAVHAPAWSQQGTSSCTASLPGEMIQLSAPGNSAKNAVDGMNVRFDRMSNIAGVDLTSSKIVISGYKVTGGTSGTSCSRSTSATPTNFSQTNLCTDAPPNDKLRYCTGELLTDPVAKYITPCGGSSGSCPFPRDRLFVQLGVATGWGSMLKGSGANPLDLDAYWANHHNGTRDQSLDTRYKIYEKEVTGGSDYTFNNPSELREPSAPQCTAGLPAATSVDRRLINVAIIDCNYWTLHGRSELPTTTVTLKMFLTEPATSEGELYGELVDASEANSSGGPVHHIVKLVK